MRITPVAVLGWWAQDYAYAVVAQCRAWVAKAVPTSFGSGDQLPIVIIPGFIETWKFLLPLIDKLHARGHPVHVIEGLGWNLDSIPDAARLVTGYLEQHDLEGVLLVTHSKGGLIGLSVMSVGAGARRVSAMVSIAGPFGGSRDAQFRIAPRWGAFSPRNVSLRTLAQHETATSRVVSLFGWRDLHILGGSHLAGAKNLRLDSGGHFRVLAHPRVLEEIAALNRRVSHGPL